MVDTYDPNKHYGRVDFKEDRLVLAGELNEAQDIAGGKVAAVGAAIWQDGQVLDGVACSCLSGYTYSVSAGKIALGGSVVQVTAANVVFTASPAALWIEVLRQQITSAEDATLVDPNTEEDVAERIKVVATPKSSDTAGDALPAGAISRQTVKVYDVDLLLRWATPVALAAVSDAANCAAACVEAEQVLATSGNFVVSGLDVSVAKQSSETHYADVAVGPGVCYLAGRRVVFGSVQKLLGVLCSVKTNYYLCLSETGVLAALDAPDGLVLARLHWPTAQTEPRILAADTGAGGQAARQRFWLETLAASADRTLRDVTGIKGSLVITATPALENVDLSGSMISTEPGFVLDQTGPEFRAKLASNGQLIAVDTQPVFRSAVQVHAAVTTLAHTDETVVLSNGEASLTVPAGSVAPAATTMSPLIQILTTGTLPAWDNSSGQARPFLRLKAAHAPKVSQRQADWLMLDGRFMPRTTGYQAAQQFTLPADRIVTSIRLRFFGRPATGNLLVQIRPVVNGVPDVHVLAEKLLAVSDVTVGADKWVLFGDPVLLRGGGEYAVTFCCAVTGWVLAAGADSIGRLSVVSGGTTTALQGGSMALGLAVARFDAQGWLAFGALTNATVERMLTVLAGCPVGTSAVLERRIDLGYGYDWATVVPGQWAETPAANMFRVRMATGNPYVSPMLAHGCLHASIGPRQGKLVSTEHTLGVGATSVTVWVECRADDVPIVTPSKSGSTTTATYDDQFVDLGDGWVRRRYSKTFSGSSTGPYVVSVTFKAPVRSVVAAYE
jgi:hypothetical protein